MKKIKLSNFRKSKNSNLNLVALVDDADYEYLSKFHWHVELSNGEFPYAVRKAKDGSIRMHREYPSI